MGPKKRRLYNLWIQESGICYLCGFFVPWQPGQFKKADPLQPTADHVIAKAKGMTRENNIRLAHAYCNRLKGSANPTDFLKDTIQINFKNKFHP